MSQALKLYEETIKNQPSANQDFKLWWLLAQARHVLMRAREKELSQYDVTAVQAAILFIIDANGGKSTPTEIARWFLREAHSTSAILSKMEMKGLVSRVRDLDNKRLMNITITKKGRQVYHQSLKRESIKAIMSCLSEEECQQLWLSLEKLRNTGLKYLARIREVPFP